MEFLVDGGGQGGEMGDGGRFHSRGCFLGFGVAGEESCPPREERVVPAAFALQALAAADGAPLDIAAVEVWLAGRGTAVVAEAQLPPDVAEGFGFCGGFHGWWWLD